MSEAECDGIAFRRLKVLGGATTSGPARPRECPRALRLSGRQWASDTGLFPATSETWATIATKAAAHSEIIDVNIHVGTGEVDQADKGLIAMQKCAKRCERREGCTAFTVQTTAQNVLLCWLRANVDLASCERGTKESRRFSTYTRSGARTR